jgi:hypothetical protein
MSGVADRLSAEVSVGSALEIIRAVLARPENAARMELPKTPQSAAEERRLRTKFKHLFPALTDETIARDYAATSAAWDMFCRTRRMPRRQARTKTIAKVRKLFVQRLELLALDLTRTAWLRAVSQGEQHSPEDLLATDPNYSSMLYGYEEAFREIERLEREDAS